MSEAEFETLLNVVGQVLGPRDVEDFLSEWSVEVAPPSFANDNGAEWPLLPFPDGATASC